ncbi:MAG: S41 family peptidase [Eubacteriales bacterium]|nr:S41 family peptidase [Eubacteriales bacterium]
MKHMSRASCKLLILLMILLMMLTSCSLLPTTITDSVVGDSAPQATGDTVTISRAEYERLKKYEELDELKTIVDTYFYQEPSEQDMLDGAEMGLLYGLNDPYTYFYTPEQYQKMWADDEGDYAGVGIQIMANYTTGVCTISRVFLNSPALEAGIHKGDILVKVNDLDVVATTLNDAVDIMRGEEDSFVNIQVLREDQVLDFVVARAQIHVNWVNSCMLDNDIGYIALYEFSGDCSVTFQAQMEDLVAKGAKALIIDLRDNPGGWVDDAVKVADLFMPEGDVATLRYRDGHEENYKTKAGALDIPLTVLVNENSASASEILSGAFQDRGRATIVGVKTYGKGVVQYVLPVGTRGAGMQLTVAQYFTPNGNEVHHLGITPDVVIEMPEEYATMMYELGDLSDVQLKKAYDLTLEKISQ